MHISKRDFFPANKNGKYSDSVFERYCQNKWGKLDWMFRKEIMVNLFAIRKFKEILEFSLKKIAPRFRKLWIRLIAENLGHMIIYRGTFID